MELLVPGEHNRRNAACALAALALAGIDPGEAAAALVEFRGVGRRFELVGEPRGIAVYDDYAHHPSEVDAVIAAAREASSGRVLAAFQPHLYSRTRHLAREFAGALAGADVVCVTEIYAAREDPVEGVTGKLVVDALTEARPGAPVGWTPSRDDAVAFLAARAEPGDLAVTIGAGDIDVAARRLVEVLG
jgi:UDP-N-acetylmuramate--alanine ligase